MNICDDAKRAKKKKRDSLFCKMFSPLIYFEQEKTIEKVSKKLYTSKLNEKKEEGRDEKLGLGLKSTNLQVVRYEAGMCIGLFCFLIIV